MKAIDKVGSAFLRRILLRMKELALVRGDLPVAVFICDNIL